jgi:Fe-S-cluster containining protein
VAPVQLGEREWTVLRQADGTRDLEGIRLAASQAGAPVRAEHVREFLRQLAHLGCFDARSEEDDAPALARDLPIEHLPGYTFACDGTGGCCGQFDTILFAPVEVARARALLPDVEDAGDRPERVFLPEHGTSSALSTVTRKDGRCLYLDTDGRCRIHAGKPAGCRTFPARFVDVGSAIRVLPRLECACVFASRPEGEPLTRATRGSELPPELFVPALPAQIAMGERLVSPAELVAFFDERSRALEGEADLAALAWRLAAEIDGAPIDPHRALRAARESVERLTRTHVAWRAPRDIVRLGVGWVRDALARIEPGALPPPIEPEDERLYLRAAFFATLGAESSAEAELRERAAAMWIARAFPDEARETREGAHPLAIVEALARGHGLRLC